MFVFILEDNPDRMKKFHKELTGHRIHHAETAKEGMDPIEMNRYDVLLLDHDLGGEVFVDSDFHNTGYKLAQFIAVSDRNSKTPCIIHSCNPAGADNIQGVLKHAVLAPFPHLDIKSIEEWLRKCQ
jgi:DNA-binding response OmpR family regulator